jgi:hypothetical protein
MDMAVRGRYCGAKPKSAILLNAAAPSALVRQMESSP